MDRRSTVVFSSHKIACAGVLIALNVILTRFFSVPIGQIFRISAGYVPVILAGLLLGPVTGGITGGAGDLIGCAVSGYVPNPLVFVSSVLVGVIPGLFRRFVDGGQPGVRRFLRILAVLAVTMLVTAQGFTVLGLGLMYGLDVKAVWVARLPQTGAVLGADAGLTWVLYGRLKNVITFGTNDS